MLCSLPDELIVLIFMHLPEGDEIDGSSWPLESRSLKVSTLLPLAHTCHHVHEIAISTQHLWRRIDLYAKTAGLEIAYDRSRDLEIDVIFHNPTIIPSASTELLASGLDAASSILSRIRTLVIVEADRNTHIYLQALLAYGMPALTTCQVHLMHKDISSLGNDPEMRFTVDPALVPKLQTLQLGTLRLDWTSEIIKKLRRLSLQDSFPEEFLDLNKFLTVLESCTSLEYLALQHSRPFTLQSEEDPPQPEPLSAALGVRVEHLRKLVIESNDPGEVSALFSHLEFSSDVFIEIYVNITFWEAFTIPSILSTDAIRLPLLEFATSVTFAKFHDYILIDISAPSPSPGRLYVRIQPPSGEGEDDEDEEDEIEWPFTPSQALEQFCALLEYASLRVLNLQLVWPSGGETCAAAGTFAHLFQKFPQVEELSYGESSRQDESSDQQFLNALKDGALSQLRLLRLTRWNENLVPSLVEALKKRKDLAQQLSDLHIVRADRTVVVDMTGSYWRDLQKQVVKGGLTVDGKTYPSRA